MATGPTEAFEIIIIAKAEITISRIIDIASVTRYYLLQSSTSAAPSKPTTNPPSSAWTTTEPSYTAGATNTLYFVDLTLFTNDTFKYSEVSKSSSYEAAKEAYNKAASLETRIESNEEAILLRATKTEVTEAIEGIKIGGRNLLLDTKDFVLNNSEATTNDGVCTITPTAAITTLNTNLSRSVALDKNQEYTFSFSISTPTAITYDLRPVAGTNITNNTIDASEYANNEWQWQKVKVTFTVTSVSVSLRGRFSLYNLEAGKTYKIKGLKLEKGNVATDWTPAPEDIETRVTTAEATIEVNSEAIELRATTKSLDELSAALTVNTDSIVQSVSKLEEDTNTRIDDLNDTTSDLREQITQIETTSANFKIEISDQLAEGVSKVITETGFTFDQDGLTISKSNSSTNTQITENGMTVKRVEDDEAMLTANKDGVDAVNLKATTYLIVGGRSRFENYGTDRTGCFWIGG